MLLHPEPSPATLFRAKVLITAAAHSGDLLARELQQQDYEGAIDILRQEGEAGEWTLAMALALAGFENFGGDFVVAESMVKEALTIARSLGDQWLIAFTLAHAGYFSVSRLDHASAKNMLEESLDLFEAVGDRRWS